MLVARTEMDKDVGTRIFEYAIRIISILQRIVGVDV